MDIKKLIAAIILIVEAVSVMCISFVYIHWTAYEIAAHHVDYEQVVPPIILCIAALLTFVFAVKRDRTNALYINTWRYSR